MGKLNRRRYKKKAKKVLGHKLWKFYPLLEEPLQWMSLCHPVEILPIECRSEGQTFYFDYNETRTIK